MSKVCDSNRKLPKQENARMIRKVQATTVDEVLTPLVDNRLCSSVFFVEERLACSGENGAPTIRQSSLFRVAIF